MHLIFHYRVVLFAKSSNCVSDRTRRLRTGKLCCLAVKALSRQQLWWGEGTGAMNPAGAIAMDGCTATLH